MIRRIDTRNRKPIVAAFGMLLRRLRIDPFTQLHGDHISETKGRDGDWVNHFNKNELSLLNADLNCQPKNE